MAFESLTERLQGVFKAIRGKKKLSEKDVQEVTKEIRLALLEADVALPVVKTFIKRIRERAIGHEIIDTLDPTQQILKIVNEELTQILGSETAEIVKSPKIPTIIMMVGLQGAGKTTFAGKLANKLIKEENARPLMIAADIYRPAAIDQLKTLGQQINVPVFDMGTDHSAVEIVTKGLELARDNRNDYVLIDTAGRLQIDDKLMAELRDIKALANPNEILLVVDSMIGQEAANVAYEFNHQLSITGVVLTKIDGDTRGGAALSVREITGKPIKFTGTGEKITDIETFHPDRMSSRILGMGDLLTLIEKASQEYDQQRSLELAEKMRENTFDFNDFIEQLDQVQNMGPMEDLLKMIPGMAGNPALANIKVDEKQIARKRAIVSSMTKEERENPELLNPSRRRRIAAGSGNSFVEVNKFIKDFNQAKAMMQGVMSGDMNKAMKQMGIDPNRLPKNMPAGSMPDMAGLESMMGQGGMPDMSALGSDMDMSQLFGGGLKGKMGQFAMKQAMKRQANKIKKAKKKRK
ncbi:signal recognition particle protein [Streptococcus uberis]|uniref:Signal recognition particle protein n=2 Tax=Streptococcus uberis TaxID=1349 RepID=B9DUB6_STRU0|nr:signal recognition particle protein [Streptococcus uberis]AUC24958.1 signal recognition particle protein [Streptococcus uberis]KKF41932.1 signal recognition particle protein Srp54 [Streptococcus uberis Ab71]KKF42955.1 signal recognition particle protein Srp54 [Streptococcus uberis C9359]KKF43957.1 signal recognition particle protein Srp54 [Streptococcus uberis EF20/0145]KKF48040.1 signal recognition particle protein Srp54 [Streptococcus uberis C5072]